MLSLIKGKHASFETHKHIKNYSLIEIQNGNYEYEEVLNSLLKHNKNYEKI